ncbi:MAG: hypothetical protein KAG37_09115, partial [Flavobacteriales bacterium]|nr:hypothetical protein [Flavobacteriales bacterium]
KPIIMETIKPIAGLLLIAGVMSFWIFQVHHNFQTDEEALTKKINSIDLKISEIHSDISFFMIDDLESEE